MDAKELEEVREQCGCYDEDAGCLEDFPPECPHRIECVEGGEDPEPVLEL